ncbi:MAG: hypothetical protein KAG56_10215, partial [Sulfurovaceae bacterium]|nr:hypothetical protein [Sulfurovaceae bacterium]
REFRKKNPNVEGTFSTWANGEFWMHAPKPVGVENYFSVFLPPPDKIKFNEPIPDGAKFLDDTFLPQDIGIALNRFYQPDQAKYVIESGRPLDIWGWYISDHEMRNNLAFNMKNIEKYFKNIPPEAGKQIRYYNTELNFHGWPQIINVYVVAQKMWNPKRSLHDIEMEFCTATFGPKYAATMVEVYNAVDAGYNIMIPNPPDFGTSDYNKRLHIILENAQKVNIADNWKANFNFPVPVTKYVDMLVARLRLILAVSEAKEQIVEARAASNTKVTSAAVKSLVFQVVDANGSSIASAPFSPNAIKLESGHSIGQTFHAIRDFSKIGIQVPTWHKINAGLTLSLYDKIGGILMAKSKFTNVVDGSWIWLESKSRILSGNYYIELSNPTGDMVGVYGSRDKAQSDAVVYFDREPIGDEDEAIKKIKQNAIKNLPNLPIDPIYNQDETIVLPAYKTLTFKEMIKQL